MTDTLMTETTTKALVLSSSFSRSVHFVSAFHLGRVPAH